MTYGATTIDLKRAFFGLASSFLIVALSGCHISNTGPTTGMTLFDTLGRTKSSEAFGADKVFGIVSITAEPYISKVGGDTSISGALSALSSDKGYLENSQKVLEKSVPAVVGHLSKTTNYLLLPPNNIVTQSDYLTIRETTNNAFNKKNIARGYRKISDKKGLALSAQSLGLDAAMHVNISYGYTQDSTNVAGLVQYGKYYATVKVDVMAVDESGKVVWKESQASVSSRPVEASTSVGDTANFTRLEPHLLQSLNTTLITIMKGLDKG